MYHIRRLTHVDTKYGYLSKYGYQVLLVPHVTGLVKGDMYTGPPYISWVIPWIPAGYMLILWISINLWICLVYIHSG